MSQFCFRPEVIDLEQAGARIIQTDEAALREGLPLRHAEWQHCLDWAVGSFRISASPDGSALVVRSCTAA